MTSSSVVPVQNADVSQENRNEIKEQSEVKNQASDGKNGNFQQFVDNQGDLPEDTSKGDSNVDSTSNSNVPEKQEEKSSEDTKADDGDPKAEARESNTENTQANKGVSEENSNVVEKSDSDGAENKSDNSSETTDSRIEDKAEQRNNNESDESSSEKRTDDNVKIRSSNEVYPSGAQSELLNESTTQTGSWSTQEAESRNEKESQNLSKQPTLYNWKLCNVTAGSDYIPCLDNWQAIRSLRSTKHYEHRERHCPSEPPTCLVSLPEGYRPSIEWPRSREKVGIYLNVC